MRFPREHCPLSAGLTAASATVFLSLFPMAAPGHAQQAHDHEHESHPVRTGDEGSQYDAEFSPAISLTVDVILDYKEYDGATKDGINSTLRRADLFVSDWIDPDAFVWATIAYEEEELNLDEAAIEYSALPGNFSLRGGRFFVDFGDQMQSHISELRTIERPLVLRDYLGEELAADGLQIDHWFAAAQHTEVRASVGVFADASGGDHAHDDEAPGNAGVHVADRKDADDLGVTARLTARTEIGASGILQIGSSARLLPDFAFEEQASALEVEGQSNSVYGVDLKYLWSAGDGPGDFTIGGEALLFDGDLSAVLNDGGTPGNPADDFLDVYDDSVFGSYLYLDHGWTERDSAGVQYSMIQEPTPGESRVGELDLYYTRQLSEFLRLRVGATLAEVEGGEDSTRLAIQVTGSIGQHGHPHHHW